MFVAVSFASRTSEPRALAGPVPAGLGLVVDAGVRTSPNLGLDV